ncbi:type 1 glutamine amidotransferase domain-containing protein [Paraglaciecola sp. MB-3u-78]|jgi:putative intracellular protease/amidase|uniref:type 1 glutamine amidotransferase domain-containing protein n=1 Tax=Paraglaciecola sp. MB-3u-78 TaxID=2058332 RepID=UPI000C334E67|nr:type 1 glutamine amidotransferase domain-containing protein [Paraglaciecola sp. MB-3u-78]PKG96196.1 type 1 glutamine amidotransferase domain-containing protein [Paraglaciecola sp. MB-3u-78]
MTLKKVGLIITVVLAAISIVYWGLPKTLNLIGLHPHYDIPAYDLSGKRALIVTTSHGVLSEEVDDKDAKATGVFGSELSIPYYSLLNAGVEVDIASIKGGKIPIEPNSMDWPLATAEDKRFKQDAVALAKIAHSIPISQIDASQYDVIFMSGGWGAAYDLGRSAELADVVTKANAKDAVIGSVCHGALGLINAKAKDGSSLIAGRNVTGVTDLQIKQLDIEMTPLHPETELRKANANYEANSAFLDIFATHVVVDDNLVTGQNQNSSAETVHRILEILSK